MPRYFFSLRCGDGSPEIDAFDLPDSRSAWREAVLLCRDLLHDAERLDECPTTWEMEVRNEAGRRILLIRLAAECFAED